MEILSVSEYIDLVNEGLKEFSVKIIGEVGKVTIDFNGHAYFSMRDEKDQSIIECAMWASKYRLYGVKLVEGMKVIAYGYPDIYKRTGRFKFICETMEPAGEGELKKKYEELKKKLAAEGLFESSKKRSVPKYAQKIGIITSKQGAVLSDFSSNIGHHGLIIKLIDSRVEGVDAIVDLIVSVKTFKKQDIEVLVIMRGGGSFESLQAFNNELLVREIASFPVPVIAAIGHDKDVPLVSLAADIEVSTPSIATVKLNESWNNAKLYLDKFKNEIIGGFKNILENNKFLVINTINTIKIGLKSLLQTIKQKLDNAEAIIYANNPERQLEVGYSIVRINGRVVKSIKTVSLGDSMETALFDGIITSEIKKIK